MCYMSSFDSNPGEGLISVAGSGRVSFVADTAWCLDINWSNMSGESVEVGWVPVLAVCRCVREDGWTCKKRLIKNLNMPVEYMKEGLVERPNEKARNLVRVPWTEKQYRGINRGTFEMFFNSALKAIQDFFVQKIWMTGVVEWTQKPIIDPQTGFDE